MRPLKLRLVQAYKHHKKRMQFLQFLKAYLHLARLDYGFMESLETMRLENHQCPWLAEFIFALHQGNSVENALPIIRHYLNELDYAYLLLSLKTNQLSDFANHYIQASEETSNINTKIKEQAFYPLFLMTLSIVLFILLQYFLLPEYQALSKTLGLQMNTRPTLSYLAPLGLILLSIITFINHFFPKLNTCVFPIFLELEIMAWAETIGLGLRAHLPLIECLILVDNHVKLRHLNAFTQSWILHLRLGLPIFSAFEHAPDILQKELSTYRQDDDFFLKLKLKFQYKLLSRLRQIERLIQPTLLFLVGLICFYFFYTLYQPLFQMGLF